MITELHAVEEPRLDRHLRDSDRSNLDLIRVEGFKRETFPKIEVHRPSLAHPLLLPHE